jgi:hypothetical protein
MARALARVRFEGTREIQSARGKSRGSSDIVSYPELLNWVSDARIVRFSCPRHNKFGTEAVHGKIAEF